MGLLDGKVCIVTGAGQGLGRAIAIEMSREGASLALLERNADTLSETAALLHGACSQHALDVTDYEAYGAAVKDIHSRHGRIDVLVNNAAINPATKTILDDTLEEWRRTIAINLEAVYMGSKLVAPIMVAQKSGRIIHISSIQGFASSGLCGSYNAAKGAIIAYTKSMAVELAPHNILVNAVAPGFMVTPMSVVNGVDETATPEVHRLVHRPPQDPLGPQRPAGGCLRHRRVPRLRLLPLHDGPAARRRWRIDEHVLTTRNHDRKEAP
jgi:3-oxoacyl-[acyl-carrier protein] reductase